MKVTHSDHWVLALRHILFVQEGVRRDSGSSAVNQVSKNE